MLLKCGSQFGNLYNTTRKEGKQREPDRIFPDFRVEPKSLLADGFYVVMKRRLRDFKARNSDMFGRDGRHFCFLQAVVAIVGTIFMMC